MSARRSHQHPAVTAPIATIAVTVRERGVVPAFPPPGAVDGLAYSGNLPDATDVEPVADGLPSSSTRGDLQLPQNLASGAFSNPHLHRIQEFPSHSVTRELSQ